MTHKLTDENFVKLEKVLSIKKRVSIYRLIIIAVLFLVVITICFYKYYQHDQDNTRTFIIVSSLALIMTLREYFGPFSSIRKVTKNFITALSNEREVIAITTADKVVHSFLKLSTSFNIVTGAPLYWGDLYGNLFSPDFFAYDWSVPEKSIYRIKLNQEKYIICPAVFDDYKEIAREILNLSGECQPLA
ncbi:MAG: hypothetical protein ABI861_04800 [Panacibacter sp.]